MQQIETDVLVIGSGAAGMVAAVEARRKGVEALLVGKGPTGKGTCSSLAGGGFNAASSELSPEALYERTLVAGRGINDTRRVATVLEEAKGHLQQLVEAGAPLRPVPRGFEVDNQGNERLIGGIRLVEFLRTRASEHGVAVAPRFHCLDLLVADGRACGVLGITADGLPAAVRARAVVLATGGAGAVYLRSDNPRAIVGDGYALALRAGVQLQDMEFVQFYPLGIAQGGMPPFIVSPPYLPESRLVDAAGNDVLAELGAGRNLRDVVIKLRDRASLHFYRRHLGGGLFLDLSAVPRDAWQTVASLKLLSRSGLDFRRQKLGIAPTVHFFMGGVVVDERAETRLPGLFAAGEVVGGLHGANRLGGNALTECVVCGSQAGARAAESAKETGRPEISSSRLESLVPPWAHGRVDRVRPEYRRIDRELRRLAWEHAGLIRTGEGIGEGLGLLSRLSADLEGLTPGGSLEGLRHERARSSLLVLRCVLEASLAREESRGAFFREDYPETDDGRWRRNLRVSLDRSTGKLSVG